MGITGSTEICQNWGDGETEKNNEKVRTGVEQEPGVTGHVKKSVLRSRVQFRK